jgi:uncharacterized protein (DUF2141 family)
MRISSFQLARQRITACVAASIGVGYVVSGCTFAAQGSIAVSWTIDGDTGSARCETYGATQVSVAVYDASGNRYGTEKGTCSDFALTVGNLSSGDYVVHATLQDKNGNNVSSEVTSDSVTVVSGDARSVRVDFDANSLTNAGAAGALTVAWTIVGEAPETYCDAFKATQAGICLYDSTGHAYDDCLRVSCASATKTIGSLPIGSYKVDLRLLDASDKAVTVTLGPASVDVTSKTTTTKQFDFSLDDLLQQ